MNRYSHTLHRPSHQSWGTDACTYYSCVAGWLANQTRRWVFTSELASTCQRALVVGSLLGLNKPPDEETERQPATHIRIIPGSGRQTLQMNAAGMPNRAANPSQYRAEVA